MLRGEDVIISGDGETTRDFCYVANVVQANLLAAMSSISADSHPVYNVAVGARASLNQLVALLRRLLGEKVVDLHGREPIFGPVRAGDVRHSEASIARRETNSDTTHRTASRTAVAKHCLGMWRSCLSEAQHDR